MSDLAAFLTARLDEDEAIAKATVEPHRWHPDHFEEAAGADQVHIARHDPARVLREVEAKRAILKAWEGDGPMDFSEPPQFWAALDIAVRALAAVWSDHPDYDPAWNAE